MKLSRKSFLSLIILSCFVLTSVNSAQAFSFRKNKNNTQTVNISGKIPVKNKKGDLEQPPYTNEVHSIFTLGDCIENAIKYNPAIQASLFNEDVYNSRIGQAWANYFPVISAGLDLSRSGDRYSGIPIILDN